MIKAKKKHYTKDTLMTNLRKKYSDKLDSIEGCLEVLEDIFRADGNIFTNRDFHTIGRIFHNLIFNAEKIGCLTLRNLGRDIRD